MRNDPLVDLTSFHPCHFLWFVHVELTRFGHQEVDHGETEGGEYWLVLMEDEVGLDVNGVILRSWKDL